MTSNKIEIERSFFDIMKFCFQCLKDNAQLITPSIGSFSSCMIQPRIAKKYHLFTSVSILINRIERPPMSPLGDYGGQVARGALPKNVVRDLST